MVILGLGSNVGDRLANLRKAVACVKTIPQMAVVQVSPLYLSDALLPENAPLDWDIPHLNIALRCETTLEPLALLDELKKIELSIGRKPEVRHWGPRIIDIDILAWDDRIIKTDRLTVPHESLQERPFALWPLADVAPRWIFPLTGDNQGLTATQISEKWGSRFTGDAPLRTRQLFQCIESPQLIGIINVTPDSFSDGGLFLAAEKAKAQAVHLVEAGAEILDIGAESTSPKAEAISPEIEWKRLEPVILAIQAARGEFILPPKISIDSRHTPVIKKALALGIDWVNDVTGLDDPIMREIVATNNADCVVMHHHAIPERRDKILSRHLDPVTQVYAWGEKRLTDLERAGIDRKRIIFDPGIGFGKMAEQSLEILQRINEFHSLNTRILVGHSRKTFMSLFTKEPFANRDIETMATSIYLANQAVDYLRVHNVEMTARGLRTKNAVTLK